MTLERWFLVIAQQELGRYLMIPETYHVQTFADAMLVATPAARQAGRVGVVGDNGLALRRTAGPAAAALSQAYLLGHEHTTLTGLHLK